MYLNIYFKKIAILLFAIINLLLFLPLINGYIGKIYYLILLFVLCNSYIYYSLRFSSFFLDKTLSIFILLVYWTLIIFAPVISKELHRTKIETSILPLSKPNK